MGMNLANSAIDPIHQFQLKEIFRLPEIAGFEFVFTNNAFFMFAAVALITLTMFLFGSGSWMVSVCFQFLF
jgi:F-type H+-transporting ATPase subunit a